MKPIDKQSLNTHWDTVKQFRTMEDKRRKRNQNENIPKKTSFPFPLLKLPLLPFLFLFPQWQLEFDAYLYFFVVSIINRIVCQYLCKVGEAHEVAVRVYDEWCHKMAGTDEQQGWVHPWKYISFLSKWPANYLTKRT